MKNLIIVGHPDINSFCYSGIFKTITQELSKNNEEIEIIDLYRDDFTRPRAKTVKVSGLSNLVRKNVFHFSCLVV